MVLVSAVFLKVAASMCCGTRSVKGPKEKPYGAPLSICPEQ